MKLTKGIALLLVFILMASVVGCGGKQKTTGEAGKVVTIKVWEQPTADATDSDKEIYELKLKSFSEKYPNIKVEQAPGITNVTDYRQQYDKALMAGQAPTAVSIFSYTDIPSRISNGTIADITDLYGTWKDKDNAIKTFNEAISKNGKWYAIPRSAYVIGTVYNRKAIKAGGGNPDNLPKTWDDFGALGQQTTDLSVPRFGYSLVGMDWCAWPFTAWVWSAGGEMVRPNSDGTYKIAFNEEAGVDAAEFWNKMVWKYKMTQKDVLQDFSKIIEDIHSGRACFGWADVNSITQTKVSQYGLDVSDFGLMAMPVKDASILTPILSGGEVVTFNPKASKEELQAAWEFYTYTLYNEEFLAQTWDISNKNSDANLQVPANPGLYEKKLNAMKFLPQSMKDDLLASIKNAKAEPYCGNWPDLKSALVKPIQTILLDQNITREKIKSLLDECAEELYKEFPNSFKK